MRTMHGELSTERSESTNWPEKEKLRSGNFVQWLKRLKIQAEIKKVADFLDPGYLQMLKDLNDCGELSTEKYTEMVQGDQLLRGLIEGGSTDFFREIIDECETCQEAVAILRKEYLPPTGKEKWRASRSIHLNNGKGFSDYVARFEDAVMKLEGAGVELDKQMVFSRFIAGLESEL